MTFGSEPGVIAKSSVVLDVKPWDDETDMKKMEEHVRKIEMDGLLWGACKSFVLCSETLIRLNCSLLQPNWFHSRMASKSFRS